MGSSVLMNGEYSDHRQEQVFVSVKLDACLLTDLKMALGWRS